MNATPLYLSFQNLNNYDNLKAVLEFEFDLLLEAKSCICTWEENFKALVPNMLTIKNVDKEVLTKTCDLGVKLYSSYLSYPTLDELLKMPQDNTYLGGSFMINFINKRLVYNELLLMAKARTQPSKVCKNAILTLQTIKQITIFALTYLKKVMTKGGVLDIDGLVTDIVPILFPTPGDYEKIEKEAFLIFIDEFLLMLVLLLQAFRFLSADTKALAPTLTPEGHRFIEHIKAYENYKEKVLSAHSYIKNLEPNYNFW